MSKISAVLNVGQRAMQNSQTALQTVSHNIANKDTEGFSRQRTEQTTAIPIGMGNLRIGMGAKTQAVRRINNPYLEKQIERESMELGTGRAKSENMTRVEQIFNEQINKGLNRFISEFFNAFRELANNPESLATRTLVKENADFLAQDFHRISRQLKSIQRDIDQQILTEVEEINAITEEIAELNKRVQYVELSGGLANDERDRRDLLIKKLSEKVDIKWGEGKDGQVSITAGRAVVLVSGYSAGKLSVAPTAAKGDKREGNYDIFFQADKYASTHSVTEQFKRGKLGGAIEIRDKVVNQILDDIDTVAFEVNQRVNSVHRGGYDIFNGTGNNFFETLTERRGAAENIQLNQKIIDNVGLIAAAAQSNSPGDNRIANAIVGVQNQRFLDGDASIDDFYNGLVGRVAILTRKANALSEHQEHVVNQLNNFRESISGVSLDEEATKLLQYQKTFDASARLIRTADEMLDTVLNLKRL
jgi:flagellar hook-associated protein 1 FlgK